MPLQRLELYNFKSYRGNQVIDFGDAPFMCIIGPNGAGKSNLMDAISFVLGVKSAQLRSTQLKDLIYRGRKAAQAPDEETMDVDESETQTQTQQSQSGDARTAHVVAVYEDDKHKEWHFKRSISTSGQSTYHLNNKAVQWTAYNAQLEHFNILVKAKNFLVFQGDVEGVASQDSRALAKLVDRISGSLDLAPRYEAAKVAQEKAAEASTNNYHKKRTMAAEVKQYKEQKEEAKQWERLRQNKDTMIQRHLLWRLYHITSAINESTRQVEETNEKLVELRGEVDADDSKLKAARKDQAQAQLTVKQKETAVKKAEKALEDKKPELLAIETQIAHSEKRAANAQNLRQRVMKDEERQSESLAMLERGADEISARMEEAAEKQRKKSQAAGKTLSKADLDEYRRLRSQANTLNVADRQQLETLRREQKTLRDALASTDDKMQQATIKKSKLQGEIDRLAEREEVMSSKVGEMSKERDSIKEQLERAQQERERINQKETEINERLQKTYNQLLQAGVDKRESERERKLKETLASLKRVFPGVHGRVIELCEPTADKYRTAVMTVLGRHIDAVVVESEKVAIDCIEYMKSQRAGQATFIPLDTIQIKTVPERLRNFTKGARLAIDCIQYAPAVERAMQHACGSSLICDTMAIAKYVCYEKAQEVKAVTLEGTVIHKSGLITGGQSSGGRKFDDRAVESLKQAKETYLQQLQDLSKSKPKDKADEGLIENLARLEAESGVARDDLDATQLRLRGLRDELKHIDAEIKKMSPDVEKKGKAAKTAEAKLEKLQTTVNAADDGVFQAFCRKIKVTNIRDYEDVQLKAAREESEAMEAFAAQKARVTHQIEFEKSQLESTRERLANLQATADKELGNVEARQSAKEHVEEELKQLREAVEKQKAKVEKYKTALDKASEEVEECREAARKTQRRLDKRLKDIAVWNDEIEKSGSERHAIYRKCRLEEIDLPLRSGSIDSVPLEEANNMEVDSQMPQVDDFGIDPDFDQLEEEDKENASESVGRDFEDQIAKLKADLDKVAPNLKAIDRLVGVENEFEDAKEEAAATVNESKRAAEEFQQLKKKRHQLFTKAHDHISGCIEKIYKDLTRSKTYPDGGSAYMSVEDTDEPYLSGIRYNVMPAGKPFADMEQLSGGEKTIAALALLFAIHSYHAAPFFVLDEVDAALDSTNVAKLARYIKLQAENNVQFLIISLKSALYEHADGLVGVYREQEENSSRTLTLDMRKYVE